jgi:hypothetical protein
MAPAPTKLRLVHLPRIAAWLFEYPPRKLAVLVVE